MLLLIIKLSSLFKPQPRDQSGGGTVGTEGAEVKTQHLQRPSTLLVHVEESWEMSPQPPTLTDSGAPTPQTLQWSGPGRHVSRDTLKDSRN